MKTPRTILFLFTFLFSTIFAQGTINTEPWIDQIVRREFALYTKTGISEDIIEFSWKKLRKKPEFHRYKIIQGQIYGQPSRIKRLLELLAKTGPVPNVDFIYYYEDRIKKSFVDRKKKECAAPIFVSAKDNTLKHFILFSDWLYDPTDETSGWNAAIQDISENQVPWESRKEVLFWRGSPYDGKHFQMYDFNNWKTIPRGTLVYQSQLHSNLIDAKFSKYPDKCIAQNPLRCRRELGAADFQSIPNQLQFKYHILIDGVTCTFPGTQWKLLSGSVPFKQDSPDIMYFYPDLIAWEHYIPVRNDLSDLLDKINWARSHDSEARKIANNARAFALQRLMPQHILEYCRAVLFQYASLQNFSPTVSSDISGRQY